MTRAGGQGLLDIRKARSPLTLVALWALATVLAVRAAAEALSPPPGRRLADLETWVGPNGVLHLPGALYDDGSTFTGTPFAGLVLRPFTSAAEETLGVAWTVGTLLIVAAVGLMVAHALPAIRSRRGTLLVAPVVICLLVLSLPVRGTLSLGQMSVLPVLLVLPACLSRGNERITGALAGLGAALQPAMLLFAPFLWLSGRRTPAVSMAGTFAAGTALAWVALPDDSFTYWIHHVAGAGLGGPADALSNQSLHGALLRLGLSGPAEYAVLGVAGVAVVWFGLRRAASYARDGQVVLGAAITGCVAVVVAPVSWQHQLLWILLTVAGRVGRTRADRLVWPIVVVLVSTIEGTTLIPGSMTPVRTVAENLPLLLAVLAACVIPFLRRDSPVWWPVPPPVDTADRTPAHPALRRLPLLPVAMRALSRPNLLLELLMIRLGYQLYSYVRASVPDQRAVAESHGDQVLAIERALFIDIEHAINQVVARTDWLSSFMGFFYESFHFAVPLTLLAYLYVRRPTTYRSARTVLCFATAAGLVGFWLYPLAPPRLMPGLGYIDTVHGPQDLANPDFGALTKISNQYAAMPSLHVGWSLWCGLVIAAIAPKLWMKALGMLYPITTTLVVMGTANHYILDAVGGAAVVGFGFAVQYVLTGRSAFANIPVAAAATTDAAPAADRAADRAADPAPKTVVAARAGAGAGTDADENAGARAGRDTDANAGAGAGTGAVTELNAPGEPAPDNPPARAFLRRFTRRSEEPDADKAAIGGE